jgi:hypothetical protein
LNQVVKDSTENKEGVDELEEMPHNLISLVLTNKTICGEAEKHRMVGSILGCIDNGVGKKEYRSLTINSQ